MICVLTRDLFAVSFKFYCPVIRQNTRKDSSHFESVKICLMFQMWSALEKLPCAAEFNVYSLLFV